MKKPLCLASLAVAFMASAHAWPDKPITLVVPAASPHKSLANTPKQFAAFQATEFARWKQLIETRKITAD